MPRKRRESDEGAGRGGAPSRRAPLYAVLARELLRHLGNPLPEVAGVGEVGLGRAPDPGGDRHAVAAGHEHGRGGVVRRDEVAAEHDPVRSLEVRLRGRSPGASELGNTPLQE